MEVTGCPNEIYMESGETSDGVRVPKLHEPCDVIKMARIPKKNVEAYNLIKIEFNNLENDELLNAALIADYVGVEFKSKNGQLFIYQGWLSLVFFVINLINTAFWFYKLSKIPRSELGTVKRLISLGLIIMIVFNMPYRLIVNSEKHLLESFVNSLTEGYMLFINLVLSHGMYASNSQSKPLPFFAPKVLLSGAVFIGLWAWSYSDLLEFDAYIKKDFAVDKEAYRNERNCFTFFLLLMAAYSVLAAWHSYRALTVTKGTNPKRFRGKAGGLVLIVSSCTVSLTVFPFSSQTLQFMNENGVVNIYMLLLAYMFSPSTEIDEEIVVDEDGNVSIACPNNGSLEQENDDKVVDAEDSDEDNQE